MEFSHRVFGVRKSFDRRWKAEIAKIEIKSSLVVGFKVFAELRVVVFPINIGVSELFCGSLRVCHSGIGVFELVGTGFVVVGCWCFHCRTTRVVSTWTGFYPTLSTPLGPGTYFSFLASCWSPRPFGQLQFQVDSTPGK